jgi:MFS family permease
VKFTFVGVPGGKEKMETKTINAGPQNGPSAKPSRTYSKYVILALIFGGWCLGNMDRMVMSYAIVSIGKEFQLNASLIGLVLSSFFIGYAIMQIPGGWLADRLGSRKVLNGIVVVWSIFTGFTGSAWSLTSLLVIRVAFGLSEGSFSPSAVKMISETFPKKETGRAISIFLMASGLMTIIVPILAAVMMTGLGWRNMFYLIGACGLVLMVLFWIFLKPRAKSKEVDVSRAQASAAEPHTIGELLRIPMIWNIILVSFSVYALSWGLNTWIPSYLVKARHLSLISIGWLQIIPGIALMGGMFLSGVILDKMKPSLYKIISIAASAISAIMLWLMYSCQAVPLFIAYQTIVYLMIGFLIVFMPAFLVKQVPSDVVGSATGLSTFGSQLAGLVTPLVIGVLVDAFKGSFVAAFGYLIVFALVSIVCFAVLKPQQAKAAS